jgi:uncharacterized protein YxjI
MTQHQYPLQLTFKFWSLSTQMTIADNRDRTVMHLQQKALKLKEHISIFADEQRSKTLFEIKADRIIDWSARYNFSDNRGQAIGAVKRRGMKSLWKANYDIYDGENVVFTITEENPWIKVLDGLLSEVPVVGWFTGYVFNPTYLVQRPNGQTVMHLDKIPTFMSRIFTIKAVDKLSEKEEPQVLLSLMMLLLLERNRG